MHIKNYHIIQFYLCDLREKEKLQISSILNQGLEGEFVNKQTELRSFL